jgi:hypothetical protein
MDKMIYKAIDNVDWTQLALNLGPPCFHIEDDGYFCFRARRWDGHIHERIHRFMPLKDFVLRLIHDERERCAIANCGLCGSVGTNYPLRWEAAMYDSDLRQWIHTAGEDKRFCMSSKIRDLDI